MNSTDFAAARQRVAQRQQQRAAEAQARLQLQRDSHAASPLARLPYPLGALGVKGLERWDLIKGSDGTRPAFRVGQVDAELLDEELLELLKGQVGDALKYFDAHIRDDWSSEIQLFIRAALFKLSIWDHDASYGAALQNLRYTDARQSRLVRLPPTTWQKALYGLFTVGGRYGWEKWEDWLSDREGSTTPTHRLLTRLTSLASTAHSAAAFVSFLAFLLNGRYRTLLDRALRMRLAPPSHQSNRAVSFEYLNRQLVWHAFTEFLLFLLPLVGISRWRRWLSRAWRRAKMLTRVGGSGDPEDEIDEKIGELAFLPERTCAICYQDQNPSTGMSEAEVRAAGAATGGGVIGSVTTDITNPYETVPCGCLYCFVCLATRLEGEEGEGWVCLRCGELVRECKPWSGDVLEEEMAFNKENGGEDATMSGENGVSDRGSEIGWVQAGSDSGIDVNGG